MKMQEAIDIIKVHNKTGYMVSFAKISGEFLQSDYFPDKHRGEELIETEFEAWALAKAFAEATKGSTCNIYVIDNNFNPVPGYKARRIKNR